MTGHPTHDLHDAEPWHDDHEDDDGHGTVLEVVLTIAAALLLAFLVQQFLVKPFKIPSGSMENTLRCGDRVLVDRLSYRFGDPKRGDVVVFNPPAGLGEGGVADTSVVADESDASRIEADGTRTATAADTNYIKRLIALPGDTVEVKGHHAYIDGEKLDEPYLRPLGEVDGIDAGGHANWGPKEVPKGTYLMLGDHRDNSADGRVFGFVPEQFLVGKAFMVYWPPKRFGGLPERDPGGPDSRKADPNCFEGAVPDGQTLDQDG
jgi:signal peptidase I